MQPDKVIKEREQREKRKRTFLCKAFVTRDFRKRGFEELFAQECQRRFVGGSGYLAFAKVWVMKWKHWIACLIGILEEVVELEVSTENGDNPDIEEGQKRTNLFS